MSGEILGEVRFSRNNEATEEHCHNHIELEGFAFNVLNQGSTSVLETEIT